MGNDMCEISCDQEIKKKVERLSILQVVNGYIVDGSYLKANVFTNLDEALDFVKSEIGKEVV